MTRFFKVFNENENHNDFQYSVGLNVLIEEFNNDPNDECVPGGFYYTTLEYISSFFLFGNHIREVFIPQDAMTVHVNSMCTRFRSNMIILSEHMWTLDDFILEFQDHLNWTAISYSHTLSEDFIRQFKDKVKWFYISSNQTLSEDFIREFSDSVEWRSLSMCKKLSEDFIREFSDSVDWVFISRYQKLSEDFIREFSNRVDWINISEYQKLSDDFIREFKDRVDWKMISNIV